MSHRERDPDDGAAERGNDWLDGILAGWLLFIAITSGTAAFRHLRAGDGDWLEIGSELAVVALALGAVIPLLRFLKLGWYLAFLALVIMAARQGTDLAGGSSLRVYLALCVTVHLLAMGYLLWIRPEFWHPDHDAEPDTPAPADAEPAAGTAVPSPRPMPVTVALAAIHHRIVAAGSACAVPPAAVRAEAGRFGVTPAMLRNEGLTLYGTFLSHFMADGQLSADEERELACLERALDLDYTSVQGMRADAGVTRSISATHAAGSSPAAPPIPAAESDASADSAPSADHTIPAALAAEPAEPVAEPTLRAEPSPRPKPSAQADISSSEPRIHSPGPPASPLFEAAAPPSTDAAGADLPTAHPADAAPPVAHPAEPEPIAAHSAEAEPITVHPSEPERVAAEPEEPALPDWFAAIDKAAPAEVPEPVDPDALADYEEHELTALLAWAGVPRPRGISGRAALERLRALHRTSTEPLETCASDHPLEPGEHCIAIRTVELFRVPAGASTGIGGSSDVPAPVLDPRALVDGSLETDRDLSGFQRAGVCRFLLTDRRLLLVAPSGQQSALLLDRIRAVQPFRNGLEVRPLRGNPVFLGFTGGVDDVVMRIDRAATDLRARPA